MIKNIKHLFLLIVFFCVGVAQAQTTDLIYHLGSTGSSVNVASVATDPSGNIFVCGDFTGTNVDFNPLGAASLQTAAATGSGFIASYDATGILKKVIPFGTTLVNKGLKVYVDPTTKNVYLLATASGSVKFFTGAGFGVGSGSGSMALVKYDNALTLKTTKIFNNGLSTNTGDNLTDITIFGPDVYVTGELFSSNVEFNPGGTSKKISSAGVSDIVVAKYDTTTLTNIFAYNIGAGNADGGAGIDLDNSGNIYLTGYFTGQNVDIDPVGSISVSEAGGGSSTGDAFVAKYNASMACQWAFNIGAAQIDRGNDILVDKSSGNVYVGGYVKKDALDVYFDPTSTSSASFTGIGLNDIFVASYTSAGIYNWHVAAGSAGEETLSSLAFDLGGNIVLSGFASGNVNFGNSKTISGLGGKDAFFAVISGTSGLATAAYNLGGASDEQANSVTVGTTGKILVAGSYTGTGDYDLGASATIPVSGTQDGFVSRHVLCTPPLISTQPSSTTKCEGAAASFTVVATGATSYQWKKSGAAVSGATNATYSIPAVSIAQAGTYTVDVTNTCQTVPSNSVTLTVSPKPTVTSSPATISVCSGTALSYGITSSVASTYTWTRAAVSGITPTTGSGSTASITEVLTNSTLLPVNVDYVITPTATTGSCVGASFTVTVTVNPKPAITSASTLSVCSGTAMNYAITSSVVSSYSWTRAIKAGITPNTGSGSTSPITETLTNSTVSPITTDYIITPTATTGSCVGSPYTLTVTVNPSVTPTVTATSSAPTICAGSSITLSSSVTNGGTPTYKWKLGSGYISGATNATYTTTAASNGDVYSVEITSSLACAVPATATSPGVTITVNPSVTPTVTATSSAASICAGASITLSSSFTNGGTPTYKWKLGNSYISGATNATYTTTAASNGDVYSVEMTSTAACASPATVTSSGITITVNPSVTPTVTATSSASTICAGASITLSSSFTNGGTPTYKWKLGSSYISGATNATYTTTAASNGDVYSVEMTSTAACALPATVTSSGVAITVNPSVTPTVTATSSATTICAAASITLTATPTNGGTPTYKWKLGSGYISGATNATYTTTAASNGDVYSVEMTSTAACASPATVTSSGVTITVGGAATPGVAVTSSATTICAGASITLTATPTNGGTPAYKWKLGSTYIPSATNATYVTTSASNNDSYTVEMTSSLSCASPSTVTSSPVVITVNPILVPSVTISTPSNTICSGDLITFTSTAVNPGSNPNYVWRKNGVAITPAATGTSYSTTTAANTDVYSVSMASNALCASPTSDVSNNITVTVNNLPTITGATSVCAGSTITLTGSGTPNATNPWTSATPSVVTITNSGIVTGIAPGTSVVTYTNSNGCIATITITVNAAASVTGTLALCAGSTTQLTGSGTAAISNAWVSATTSVATVSNTGLITGIAAGTSVITYTTNGGCSKTVTVTVNALPAITGTPTVCVGSATQLIGSATSAPSNAWMSSSTGIATVSNSGLVTGVAAGTSVITYTNSNSCVTTQTVTVNPLITPVISITANNSTICANSSITFTATATDAGTTQSYKWKRGSAYISGATNDTYTTTTAVNGDSYSVEMTSNAICASTNVTNSNSIAITVTTSVTPTVSITASPSNTICAGTSVLFTATAGNGGSNPSYQWKKGGATIPGATNATYSSAALTNGDQISVDMVSNSSCASTTNASSAPITMVVNPVVSPTVSITASSTNVCAGSHVSFTSSYTNQGTTPLFEWFVNTVSQGAPSSSDTYSSTTLSSGDQVLLKMTSSLQCVTSATVPSNTITIIVTSNVTPVVTITSDKSTICAGGTVVYTAVPVNGGTASYQWKINGTNSGSATTSNTFSTSGLSDGDIVTTVLTSSNTCVTSATALSNALTITVAPATQIVSQPGDQSVCSLGNNVTFSVGASGDNLTYQWKTGSTNLSNNSTYSGVTTKDLIISNVSNADLLGYKVTITGTCGTLTSNVANLTQSTSAIVITTQPVTQVLETGEMIQLSVTATGPTLSYQWKKNGVDLVNDTRISGANTASLQISNALVSDSDNNYTCLIMSPCAAQLSSNATSVTVTTATSTQDALTKGFVIAPNPSAGHFTLSNTFAPFVVEELQIISMEGVVVARKTIAGTTNLNEEVYAQDLPKGMYLLLIKGEGEQALLKVIFDK